MKIQQKKIRNIERHLPETFKGRHLHIGIIDIDQHRDRLVKIGFTEPFTAGDAVLPANVGPVSRFNADGKEIIRRDLPKETVTYQILAKWKE